MTAIWYYVLPMLLGRTYDMKTDSPGVDIFPQSEIDNATVIRRHFTDSQYRMVSDAQEARDFLGVSGELSLKLKTGKVQIEGLGNYMKETYSRSKVVEILVKVHYETETYTLQSTAKPREGWRTLDQRDIGSHYVRSITYGGDMVASLRFTAKNAIDREKIRGAVQANLHADSGSFGLGVEGNFSQLQEDLKDSSTLEINYYATVPIKGVPNTMESLMELVEDFPAQTQLVNHGIGVPLSMELFPLSALDSDVPRYLETKALVDLLDLIESQFDDIRATKKALQEWLLNVPPILSEEMEKEVGLFNDELEKISFVFYKVLGSMDLGEEAGTEQFQEAFDAYEGNDGYLPDKYYRKFNVLIHKIIHTTKALTMDVGGAIYTHWGQVSCDSQGTDTLFTGIIVSTDRIKGGSANVICLTDEPEDDEGMKMFKRHHRYYSKLSPVHLHGRNISETSTITCAMCYVADRTAPTVFPGRQECPQEWTLEYRGYMMSKDMRSRKGEFVCVDPDTQTSSKNVLVMSTADKADYMADVKIGCGTLPCDKYEKNALLPCVVCTY